MDWSPQTVTNSTNRVKTVSKLLPRPMARVGSFPDLDGRMRHARFAPMNRYRWLDPLLPKSAKTESDKPYSITSPARARRFAGISIPSDFAVFRLMTSRYLEGCSIGSSAGLASFRIRST